MDWLVSVTVKISYDDLNEIKETGSENKISLSDIRETD